MTCKNIEINSYDMNVDGNDSTLFVIIDRADEILGSCMLFHEGLIQDFHIAEKVRRLGMGSDLLDSVVEKAKEEKIYMIRVIIQPDNIPAMRFWNKNGFVHHSVVEHGLLSIKDLT